MVNKIERLSATSILLKFFGRIVIFYITVKMSEVCSLILDEFMHIEEFQRRVT